MHTAHSSESPGSWVSITFDSFEGTLLSMFGPVTPLAGPEGEVFSASAVIDGGSPILLPPPHLNFQSSPNPNTSFNTPLFNSPLLSPGKHTINFTVSSDSAIPLFVDYFLIQSDVTQQLGSPSTAIPNTFAASTPTATPLFNTTSTSLVGPSPSPEAQVSSASGISPSSHVAAIVGGCIAAVVLIILLLAGVLIWRRRRRRRQQGPSSDFFMVPAVTQWSGKGAYVRDSMATLTDANTEAKPGSQWQEPRPGSRYLYHPDA